MQQNSDKVITLCGNGNFEQMPGLKKLAPFSDIICGFLNQLSAELMKMPEAKQYPDVITFGFFCRRGNLERMKESYGKIIEKRLGRGVSFHIAPSNVPINFAYSMAAAVLAGNSCIVRASGKDFRQIDIVCECIDKLCRTEQFSELADYICVVKYPHSDEITDYFSSLADIRVIWGGDNTISGIRKSPLHPRAVEIAFADRYSIAVFDAAAINACGNPAQLAQDFYNDTYLYDQNACSSPRLIYWLGTKDEAEKAMEKFWGAVHALLLNKYKVEYVIAVDKLTAAYRTAIDFGASVSDCGDNLISRIRLSELVENIYDYRCAGGSFLEYINTELSPLSGIVTRKYQTLSYYGIDKERLAGFVTENGLCGIDRIVPVGKTADFSLIWDGFDLITQMSRIVCI